MRKSWLTAGAVALALVANPGLAAKDKKKKDENAAAKAAKDFSKDPYPSTYRPYPGAPVLITGVTVFDGKGGRIDQGQVLLSEGKVVAVAGPLADLDLPANVVRIDGTGKFVTPGIIDIHSPRPESMPMPTATR
jgi:adenine deaminase